MIRLFSILWQHFPRRLLPQPVAKSKVGSCGVRRVQGLKWAELRQDAPFKKSRPRQAALKRGIAYEKTVGRELKRQIKDGSLEGELFLDQWILFADLHGIGWAQPDAYILMENRIASLHSKIPNFATILPAT